MKRHPPQSFLLLTLLAILGLSSALHAQDLTVRVHPEKERYLLGWPIILRCEYSNTGAQPITLDLGDYECRNIVICTTKEDGSSQDRTFSLHRGGYAPEQITTVEPGKSFTRYVLLDFWFCPTDAGTYRMKYLLRNNTHEASDPFEINVVEGAEADRRVHLMSMADKYDRLWKDSRIDSREKISYRDTFMNACGFLDRAPRSVWAPVYEKYRDNHRLIGDIGHGRETGPQGIQVLD